VLSWARRHASVASAGLPPSDNAPPRRLRETVSRIWQLRLAFPHRAWYSECVHNHDRLCAA
jgi:hypothetical protein